MIIETKQNHITWPAHPQSARKHLHIANFLHQPHMPWIMILYINEQIMKQKATYPSWMIWRDKLLSTDWPPLHCTIKTLNIQITIINVNPYSDIRNLQQEHYTFGQYKRLYRPGIQDSSQFIPASFNCCLNFWTFSTTPLVSSSWSAFLSSITKINQFSASQSNIFSKEKTAKPRDRK